MTTYTVTITARQFADDDQSNWDEFDVDAHDPDDAVARVTEMLNDPESDAAKWYGTDAVVGTCIGRPTTFTIL